VLFRVIILSIVLYVLRLSLSSFTSFLSLHITFFVVLDFVIAVKIALKRYGTMSAAAVASRTSQRTAKKRATSLTATTTSKSPTKKPTLKQPSSSVPAESVVNTAGVGEVAAVAEASCNSAAAVRDHVEMAVDLPVEASANAGDNDSVEGDDGDGDEESVHTAVVHSALHDSIDANDNDDDDDGAADNNTAGKQDVVVKNAPMNEGEESGNDQPPQSRRISRSAASGLVHKKSAEPPNVVSNISLPGHSGDVLHEIKALRKALQLPAEDSDLFDVQQQRQQQQLDQHRKEQHQNGHPGHDRSHGEPSAASTAAAADATAEAYHGRSRGGATTAGAEGAASGSNLSPDRSAVGSADSDARPAPPPPSRSKPSRGDHNNTHGSNNRGGSSSENRGGETSVDAWTAKRLATEQAAVQTALMAAASDIPIEVCWVFMYVCEA